MLFKLGKFKSAAGLDLDWKIECDALTQEDWECIAKVWIGDGSHWCFGEVFGVPNGGIALANALTPYRTKGSSGILVCDDVWTTGKSMTDFAKTITGGLPWVGFVAFARGQLSHNVMCFAEIHTHQTY